MGEQRHKIQRQILELRVRSEEQARALQPELSRLHEQRIAQLVERLCTECSEPDRLHRIERVEVDLGRVDARDFEGEFMDRLADQLPPALAEQVRVAERDGDRAAQLELLEQFARSGTVPWWADLSHPHLLDDVLRRLMRDAPEPLAWLLRDLAREQGPLRRIVRHCDDRMLADLVGFLSPALGSAPGELLSLMPPVGVLAGRPPAQLKDFVWQEVLRAACLEDDRQRAPAALYRVILTRVAAEAGVTYASLVSQLRSSPRLRAGGLDALGRIVEALSAELPPPEDSAPRVASDADLAEIQRMLDELEHGESLLAGLFALCRPAATRLPTRYRGLWISVLRELEWLAGQPGAGDDRMIQGIARLVRPAVAHRLIPAPALRRWLTDFEDSAAAGLSTDAATQLSRLIDEVTHQGAPDAAPSDSEELYVENAGLVILWPFLGRFFEHLGLVVERQFRDEAAVHRGVGLLQYLATEDSSPPEYLLPLNKVLCGMPVTEVLDFGPPASTAEAEECRALLEAAILQAPILKNMSIAGLRGTFLLRRGVLGARDGAWLLRVERESFDVVLDRLPWDLNWVRLPWMAAPLRVEW